MRAGDAPAGAAWLKRAAGIAPRVAGIAESLAAALLRTAAPGDAVLWLKRTIVADPGRASPAAALARAELAHGQTEPSRRRLDRALAIEPQSTEVWQVRSMLARESGRLADALGAARKMAVLSPGEADALMAVAQALHGLGECDTAERSLLRALANEERAEIANHLVVVRAYFASTAALDAAVRRCAQTFSRSRAVQASPPVATAKQRLRIGYVSADLHDHPVGHNLIGLLEAHDRSLFDIYCYSGAMRTDALTRRAQAASRDFRAVAGLSDVRLAALIRADAIDILVHVAGRFSGNRPGLPRLRAAPVQLSFHDLTSTGETAIDGWLSDPDLHPEDSGERFVEPVLTLPHFYNFETLPAVETGSPPARRNGHVTFGSANNPSKWSSETLTLWAEVLRQADRSRLWLKFHARTADPPTRRLLAERLSRHGLPIERVIFDESGTDKTSHLAALATIDIALDPHPFAGATASFEALWMGIPVVTLAGDRVVGRTGASLARRVGLDDLVAPTRDRYVAAAKELAVNLDRLARLRASLRERLIGSALLDRAAYVGPVEALYISLWETAISRSELATRQ